jgi:hypothetical protein
MHNAMLTILSTQIRFISVDTIYGNFLYKYVCVLHVLDRRGDYILVMLPSIQSKTCCLSVSEQHDITTRPWSSVGMLFVYFTVRL